MHALTRESSWSIMSDLLLDQPDAMDSAGSRPGETPPWRRWSRAFDLHNFSTNTIFTNAIWMIYLVSHGYSPLDVGLLEMLFHVAKFITEIPTGIFADMLGRRKSLVVYCALLSIESLLFLLPTP